MDGSDGDDGDDWDDCSNGLLLRVRRENEFPQSTTIRVRARIPSDFLSACDEQIKTVSISSVNSLDVGCLIKYSLMSSTY